MTKYQFDEYNGLLFCRSCKKQVPKIHVDHKQVYPNGEIQMCNVCSWFKRNHNKRDVPGFSQEDVYTFVRYFLYDGGTVLNDIADKLNRSLDEILYLHEKIKIANKPIRILTECELCGKKCSFRPKEYKNAVYHYCSHECYYKDKSNKVKKGSQHPDYKRIETQCTNCGKDIQTIPYNYNRKNLYGDNHNFCSQKCYWAYRSQYYVGDKSNCMKEFTEEARDRQRALCINRLRDMPTKNTSIQIAVNELLDRGKILYEREYNITYYSIDNYLKDYNLGIEVMGDYWHANPLKYNSNKKRIDRIQYKDIVRDKRKHTYVKKHCNFELLYLWEEDIKKNIDLCNKLILYYILNMGVIENYHSFNWRLTNDRLELGSIIYNAHFECNKEEVKSILMD